MAKNIGLGVLPPEQACSDANCPFHGSLPVRGQVITGKVVSDRMMGTV
ncbi:MAG TPA: 30S ribosomal protein S17, partial [Methanoregulaceae archaeon]|nr:30S ribosomal protein S17 [Methanoregulaceae archaeon]